MTYRRRIYRVRSRSIRHGNGIFSVIGKLVVKGIQKGIKKGVKYGVKHGTRLARRAGAKISRFAKDQFRKHTSREGLQNIAKFGVDKATQFGTRKGMNKLLNN